MYETFGAVVTGNTVEFRLFFPDKGKDATQYVRGDLPRIQSIQIRGDFQSQIGSVNWQAPAKPTEEAVIVSMKDASGQGQETVLKKTNEGGNGNRLVDWSPDGKLALLSPVSGPAYLVAVENGKILAVGSVTDAGSIGLNYVSPDARFRGVSRALLQALEARAIARDNRHCTLTSTETARRFYQSNGYVASGVASGAFGTDSGYPMSKILVASGRTS